jgi:hypothetical protein
MIAQQAIVFDDEQATDGLVFGDGIEHGVRQRLKPSSSRNLYPENTSTTVIPVIRKISISLVDSFIDEICGS